MNNLRGYVKGFIVARTIKEVASYLKNYDINILWLHHDLGEKKDGKLLHTGYDLVKYM
ncbi:cyclic-phosphate processing receiver domain-containing protein [Bacillus sp. HMA207]|uniref:cyclic-phosphate processing receiver domain-containing protein n=1 Tax=Bacillus TaxID=1386 RepID=UPI0039C89B87